MCVDCRWLLIFDNVEAWNTISTFWPLNMKRQGSIILTTQKSGAVQLTRSFDVFPVGSLSPDEGAILLLKYTNLDNHDETQSAAAAKISQLVGGLPLALTTVGGYCGRSQYTLVELLHNLQSSLSIWSCSGTSVDWAYEKTLQTVFDTALEELPRDARDLLEMLAFLNPDSIPEKMLMPPDGSNILHDLIQVKQERQALLA
jgi:hypothetical protein